MDLIVVARVPGCCGRVCGAGGRRCVVRSATIAIGIRCFWQAVSHGPLERGDGAKGECDEEEGGGRFDARALVHAVAGVAVS